MALWPFGSYAFLCRNIPSQPTCNIFFRQLLILPENGMEAPSPSSQLLGLPSPANSAAFNQSLAYYASGSVNPACAIPRMGIAGGQPGSLGNIANIILCAISVLVAVGLAAACGRRIAAVGRSEMRTFFLVYGIVQVLNLLDTGGIFQAGSIALTWISGIHLGMVAGL
jgi:hypothetical protein